jgi:hypothetical protein
MASVLPEFVSTLLSMKRKIKEQKNEKAKKRKKRNH